MSIPARGSYGTVPSRTARRTPASYCRGDAAKLCTRRRGPCALSAAERTVLKPSRVAMARLHLLSSSWTASTGDASGSGRRASISAPNLAVASHCPVRNADLGKPFYSQIARLTPTAVIPAWTILISWGHWQHFSPQDHISRSGPQRAIQSPNSAVTPYALSPHFG